MRVITERVVGYFPLSIATSLALEALVGHGLDENGNYKQTPPKTENVDVLYVNVRTLVRNAIGSVETTDVANIDPGNVVATVYEELEHIKQILEDHAPHITLKAYYAGLVDIDRRLPGGELRVRETPLQKANIRLAETTLKGLLPLVQAAEHLGRLDRYPNYVDGGFPKRTLMLTHYPLDLLAFRNYRSLALLESHTGAVKNRDQWHTKFSSTLDLTNIPFNSLTIRIFGDSETFKPLDLRTRRAVIELAKEKRWSWITSPDQIRMYFSSAKLEPETRAILRKLA